ncbi:MAG: tetratricopeptide repeat protein, partial [Burkholderiales bacterium]|nr:tetratricopeptide repeat protein [Anaerolineae bacterium]
IEIDPDYGLAFTTRGNLYFGEGEYNLALDDFNRAVEIDVNNVFGYLGRGAVYEMFGEWESALTDYQKYLSLVGEDANEQIIERVRVLEILLQPNT